MSEFLSKRPRNLLFDWEYHFTCILKVTVKNESLSIIYFQKFGVVSQHFQISLLEILYYTSKKKVYGSVLLICNSKILFLCMCNQFRVKYMRESGLCLYRTNVILAFSDAYAEVVDNCIQVQFRNCCPLGSVDRMPPQIPTPR